MLRLLLVFMIILSGSLEDNFLYGKYYNTKNTVADQSRWSALLDPKNKEFYKEGNHIPDEGFILFATNPTLENAKKWVLRNELKAKRLKLMLKLVDQANYELIKEGKVFDSYGFMGGRAKGLNQTPRMSMRSLRRLEYYFLYSPNCGYCHEMAKDLIMLPNLKPLQVMGEKLVQIKGLPRASFATKETMRSYVKDGKVPTLVIYAGEKKKAKILKGVKPISVILEESKNLLEER